MGGCLVPAFEGGSQPRLIILNPLIWFSNSDPVGKVLWIHLLTQSPRLQDRVSCDQIKINWQFDKSTTHVQVLIVKPSIMAVLYIFTLTYLPDIYI